MCLCINKTKQCGELLPVLKCVCSVKWVHLLAFAGTNRIIFIVILLIPSTGVGVLCFPRNSHTECLLCWYLLLLWWGGQVDLDPWCVTSHVGLECQKNCAKQLFRQNAISPHKLSWNVFCFPRFVEFYLFTLYHLFCSDVLLFSQFCFLRPSGRFVQTIGERGQRTHRFDGETNEAKTNIACKKRRTNFGAWKKPQNK